MNKTLIAIVSAALAVTSIFASSAQAGFKGRFAVGLAVGALLAHQHYEHEHWRKRHIYVQRRTEKVYVSRKTSSKKDEDKADTPAVDTAQSENSSITTAALTPAEQETPVATTESLTTTTPPAVDPKPAEATTDGQQTAKKLDCKKFFPSVGMTLTVPCE